MRTLVLAWLSVVAVGCAGSAWQWQPAQSMPHPTAKDHRGASAVFVERSLAFRMHMPRREAPSYLEERHEAIAILTEGGFKYAQTRIAFDDESTLVLLKARTIGPDGTVQEVKPEEVLEGEQHSIAEQERHKLRYKTFRFPGIKVGSIVEYVYRIDRPNALYWKTDRISAELPVLRYHLEIDLPDTIHYGLKLYNSTASFQKSQHEDRTVITLDMRDIPAAGAERLAPPWQTVEPRWAYRARGFARRLLTEIIYDTWPSTMARLAKTLYLDNDRLFVGTNLKIDVSACAADTRCVVDRATTFVHEKTSLTKLVSGHENARPLKEVLSSGLATNFEKALLLWGVLRANGVTARFALIGRESGLEFDHDFPLPKQHDHLLVVVEPPGAPRLFVDPACESCAVGQLSSATEAREALILSATATIVGEPEVRVEFMPIQGLPAHLSRELRQHDLDADASGSLAGKLLIERHGHAAVESHLRTRQWLLERWQKDLGDYLQKRSKTARVVSVDPQVCEPRRAECKLRVGYTIAGHGAVDAKGLVLPLTILRSPWDVTLNENARRNPLFIPRDEVDEELVRIRLPTGFKVDRDGLPEAASITTSALDVALTVTQAGGVVEIRRTLRTRAGVYPKSDLPTVAAALKRFADWRNLALVAHP